MTMRSFTASDASYIIAQIEQLKRDHPALDDDMDLLRDTIAGETEFSAIIAKVVAEALESRFLSDGLSSYIEAMKARQSRLERKGDALRSLALDLMNTAGETKLTLPLATISVRQGPSSVVIEDLEAIPQGMFRIETTKIPLKKELKDALSAGDVVPGARLSIPEPSLQIRSK